MKFLLRVSLAVTFVIAAVVLNGTAHAQVSKGGTPILVPRVLQSVAPPAAVTGVNPWQGQPGDTITITGVGFGEAGGEVHFVVNPGRDSAAAPILSWHDTAITAVVPPEYGIAIPFNGTVYVVRRTDGTRSAALPFVFNPALDVIELPWNELKVSPVGLLPQEVDQGWGSGPNPRCNCMTIQTFNNAAFWGYKMDNLVTHAPLLNGWTWFDAQVLQVYAYGGAGAYVKSATLGTNTGVVLVRVWVDAISFVDFAPRVWIRGPKGVPYQ